MARQSHRGFSFKAVLFVCFLLVAILPVVFLGAWVQQTSYQKELDRVHESHFLVAKNLTAALDRYALDVLAATDTVAALLQQGAGLDSIPPLLEHLSFNHLCLIDANNQTIANANAPSAGTHKEWPAGIEDIRAKASSELAFIGLAAPEGGVPGLWLAKEYDDGRLLVGVLETHYFQTLQSNIVFGDKGHAAIVDATGAVLAHPNPAWVQQSKSLAAVKPVKAMMSGEVGVTEFYSPALKADMIAGYSVVPSTGWGVMVPQPLSELKAIARHSQSLVLVVGGVGLVLAALIAWFLSGWVTEPVARLARFAASWSGENRVNLGVMPHWLPSELGQLRSALIRMSKRVNLTYAELREQAEKDGLTGLMNRTEVQVLLDQVVDELNDRGASKLGLLYVDLDRFKIINDSLGHAFGDAVLVDVAARLKESSQDGVVARLGGDEFLVVMQGLIDRQGLFEAAQNVVEQIQQPFFVGDHSVQIDCAIGIAIAPDDGGTAELCLRRADVAMYHAKRDKEERICFYAPFMQADMDRRQSIEQELRQALCDSKLTLAYQPRVDIDTGHAGTVEALLRWPDQDQFEGAPIPEVISVAEHTGLISELGRWVLQRAFNDLRNILSSDGTPIKVSVNLSATQFSSSRFAENLMAIVLANDFDPQRLEIEITETTAMADVDQARKVLEQLASHGIYASIDDFGTGYSSLSYLKKLPVSFIKIDRSFVSGVDENVDDKAIVRTILSLSKTLGIPTVAEGVETKSQLEFLKREGCEQVQGYWFAKPMMLEDMAAWMSARAETLGADGLKDGSHLEETTALALNLYNLANPREAENPERFH